MLDRLRRRFALGGWSKWKKRRFSGRIHLPSLLPDGLTRLPIRYTAAKRALLANTSLQDDVKTHMLSSLVAGTVATTICAPADVLKSRIQAASKAGAGSSVSLFPLSNLQRFFHATFLPRRCVL